MRVPLLLALSLTLLPAPGIQAAVPGPTQERGKRAIEEMLAALGGERFQAVRDRVESGRAYSFYREQLSGLSLATIYTRYLDATDQPAPGSLWVEERQSFGKKERDGAVLFFDSKGYQITFRGARPVPQETLDRYRDSMLHNIFYILRQRLREPGLLFDYRGADTMDNRAVHIVDITDADNRVVKVYIDQSTTLPVRQLYVRRDPKTRDRFEEVTIFSKYRDAGGGVQWPFDIQRLRNDEKIFEIYSESVEVNKGLTDDLFTLPSGIKVLPRAK